MLTALLVSLVIVLVLAAGEAVRSQCRRMLAHPVTLEAAAVDATPAAREAVA